MKMMNASFGHLWNNIETFKFTLVQTFYHPFNDLICLSPYKTAIRQKQFVR